MLGSLKRPFVTVGWFTGAMLTSFLTACATPPPFEVRETTRLDDTGQHHHVISAKGNRLSAKSVSGGTIIDELGVYLNPVVVNDDDRFPESLGIAILNHTTHDTRMGRPNALGVPRLLIFVLDGKTLGLPILGGTEKLGQTIYDPLGAYVVTDLKESGIAPVTLEQYSAIVSAKNVRVRIVGTRQAADYAMAELDAGFLPNLRGFFAMYVSKNTAVALKTPQRGNRHEALSFGGSSSLGTPR
jgi:hypothetical protein